jgi:hypothetical protein
MVNLVILGDFYGISVAHDHWYVPLFVSNSRSFPHSWLITGFVAWVKRRVPVVEQELQHSKLIYGYFTGIIQRMALVEQELLNLRKQMGTPPFCPFSFGHCFVCSSSITDSDYPPHIFKLFCIYVYPSEQRLT